MFFAFCCFDFVEKDGLSLKSAMMATHLLTVHSHHDSPHELFRRIFRHDFYFVYEGKNNNLYINLSR